VAHGQSHRHLQLLQYQLLPRWHSCLFSRRLSLLQHQLRALCLDARAQLGGLGLGALGAHRVAPEDFHRLQLQRAVRRGPRGRVERRLALRRGAQPAL